MTEEDKKPEEPKPASAPISEPLPPTTAELKALIQQALDGSKTAAAELKTILADHQELKAKVARLEEQLAPKPEDDEEGGTRADQKAKRKLGFFDWLGGSR